MNPDDVRLVVALLGAVAFGLLTWRLITWWSRMTVLEHVAVLLLNGALLIAALATARLISAPGAPVNEVLYLLALHRVACIVFALMWPAWFRRDRSPFRRPWFHHPVTRTEWTR